MTGAPGEPRPRPNAVYYFATCLVDLFYPEAGLSGIRLLQREGVRVVFPRGQSCCGQPAFNSGYAAEAREVARAQLRRFPGEEPVVVPSGSCTGMIRRHYPELFAGDRDEAAARGFAGRVVELTRFLVDRLNVRLVDRGAPVRVTWHPSCHALRECGVDREPLELLAQLSDVTVAPLAREWECCGFGGTFAVRHPAISGAMADDKAAAVEETGAEVLLSGDAGCLMNVGGRLQKRASPIALRHIAEFLWERTRGR